MIKNFPAKIALAFALTASFAYSFKSVAGPSQSVSDIELAKYCKQLVGDIMGRNPESMRTDKTSKGITSISYIRADDGKKFKYQCKGEGGNIIWRGVDLFRPGGGPGRWRYENAKAISSFK